MIELLIEGERALSMGRLDRAEELYRQVADADPRQAMAVVGLARVALERRDDLGAYLLARRALTIDPENDAARRLAVRLEEVLATRGDPVDDPLPAEAVAQVVAQPPISTAAESPPSDVPSPPASTPSPAKPKRRGLLARLRRR